MNANDIDVSVVIVSYNTADLLPACLESIGRSAGVSMEVFVVDNASQDGSVSKIENRFPNVVLIPNDSNRGFGPANNQAIKKSAGRYILLLNPDTTVRADSIQKMVTYMNSHPDVGLAGPAVVNPDGSRQDSVSMRYPGQRHTRGELDSLPGKIACVLGACQIVRSRLLHEIGGFDEDFFLYGEDQDLCLRIRKKGFAIGQAVDAVILHHGGQSERSSSTEDVLRKKKRAEYLFYRKHYRPASIARIRMLQRLQAQIQIFVKNVISKFGFGGKSTEERILRYKVLLDEISKN